MATRYGASRTDGHTGLSNQAVQDEQEVERIRFRLSYLRASDGSATFIIHADPRFRTLSSPLQPEHVLQRLGFQPFANCPILGGPCYFLVYAQAHVDDFQRGDIFANQYIHEGYRRFLQFFPSVVAAIMDVDFKLRQAGFDVFPWEGASMKPWDISQSQTKEIFVPPAHEHAAYVAIRDIVKQAVRQLVIADPYVDSSLFTLLTNVSTEVEIRILTRSLPKDFTLELDKFRKDGHVVEVKIGSRELHDRFILVGSDCFHLGASIKDAGAKGFAINRIEEPEIATAIRQVIEDAWSQANPL